MTPKRKTLVLYFIITGLFFALLFWAKDSVEGESFIAGKFVVRFLIYGAGMTLAFYLANRFFAQKPVEKNNKE
jgi:apolipoprotein N-acyltransferase